MLYFNTKNKYIITDIIKDIQVCNRKKLYVNLQWQAANTHTYMYMYICTYFEIRDSFVHYMDYLRVCTGEE